ncbi:hypothetical protein FB451DRAFT_1167399 [Mycena latifolia]|nr:hypothetical protein FB451DRAFT_1167399 [Mycena latifolia]
MVENKRHVVWRCQVPVAECRWMPVDAGYFLMPPSEGRDYERELNVKDDARDIMSLLMKSNMSAELETHLTGEELVASTSMIIFAATDTTLGAMNRVFHPLSLYPEVQEKLRAEILAAPERLDHDVLVVYLYLEAISSCCSRAVPRGLCIPGTAQFWCVQRRRK